MGDNTRQFGTNLVDEYLENEAIEQIPRPTKSLDRNSIANLRDYPGNEFP